MLTLSRSIALSLHISDNASVAAGNLPVAIRPSLSGLRCLVLGAGGFLGQALTGALRDSASDVNGYGRGAAPGALAGVPWTTAMFEDAPALAKALRGQEVVFHLLGASLPHTSNRDPAADVASSVIPTLRLLDLCRVAGVRRVVFASSGGTVYGVPAQVPTPEDAPTLPISAYGINKLMIERYLHLYAHLHGLEHQVLRIANPYGPGQSPFRPQGVVGVMMHAALLGRPVEMWGTGEVTRDFIHVDDVSQAFIAAAAYQGPHRIMNVGSGQGRSLNAVARDVAAAAGRPGLAVVRTPARAADVPISVLDTALIRQETGWAPRMNWFAGLAGTAAWMRVAHDLAPSNLAMA